MYHYRDESDAYHRELGCHVQPEHGGKDWIERGYSFQSSRAVIGISTF